MCYLPPTILFVGFNLILWTKRPILEEHGGDFGGFFTFPSARRAGRHRAPARFAARREVSTRLAHTMILRHPPTTAKTAAARSTFGTPAIRRGRYETASWGLCKAEQRKPISHTKPNRNGSLSLTCDR